MGDLAWRALASGRVGEELHFSALSAQTLGSPVFSVDLIALILPFTLREVDS